MSSANNRIHPWVQQWGMHSASPCQNSQNRRSWKLSPVTSAIDLGRAIFLDYNSENSTLSKAIARKISDWVGLPIFS